MSGKLKELSPRDRKQSERLAGSVAALSKDEALAKALKVLEVVGYLSQRERRRVLQYALKLNDL
ncbi:MAG: hypothetical protein ACRD88_14530 [Terriglobia bacterium]